METMQNPCNYKKEEITSRDYFYFKEVILGMREEYRKSKEILDGLTYLVAARGDYLPSDFVFTFCKNPQFKNGLSESIISCDFFRRETAIQKLVSLFRQVTGLHYLDCGLCVMDENGKYHITLSYDKVWVKNGKNEEFAQIAKQALNTAYAQNAATGKIIFSEGSLEMNAQRLHLTKDFNENTRINTDYYFVMDTMYSSIIKWKKDSYKIDGDYYDDLQISKNYMSEATIQPILNQKIEKSVIPLYHQNIIESNWITGKTISFSDNPRFKSDKVILEEKEKEIIFQKVKNR